MRNSATLFSIAAFFFALFALVQPTAGHAQGIAQYFNWQTEWGAFDLNSDNDPKVPSRRNGVKMDTENVVKFCRSTRSGDVYTSLDTDYSKIKAYKIDFNNDGRLDIVNDETAYFDGVAQTGACPQRVCSDHGCAMALYMNVSDTQVIEGTPTTPCPATAALNTTCRKECAATFSKCPGLFSQLRSVKWDGRIFNWSFVSGSWFNTNVYEVRVPEGTTRHLYRPANPNRPVFRVKQFVSNCTTEERDLNYDGDADDAGEDCIKYLQYTDSSANFVDLYLPTDVLQNGENDTRFLTGKIKNDGSNPDEFFNYDSRISDRGQEMGEGKGFRLVSDYAIAAQVQNYTGDGEAPTLLCKEYWNNSDNDVFVPANTDVEYASFIRAVANGNLSGVQVRSCQHRFTEWVGRTSCTQVAPACDQTITIAANRKCQRSTSAYAECDECNNTADNDLIAGWPARTCFFTTTCRGAPCSSGNGGHSSCLPAETLISMADGTTKPINMVKIGDMVMAFDTAKSLDVLKPAKVKAVMITGEQVMIGLNDLKLTANHKVVMEDGRLLAAKSVKVGQKIVKGNGELMEVMKITENLNPDTVYNMDVEGADGYIAGGLRVMDFPAPENTEGM
jgi:hypothetical protein